MFRIIAFLISFFALATSLNAQALRDIVTLKNGSKIKGRVVSENNASSLKIVTTDGSELVYSIEEVLRIEKYIDPDIAVETIDSSYSSIGVTFGTPTGLNVNSSHWFGRVGLHISGMSYRAKISGTELGINYKLSDNSFRSHSVGLNYSSLLSVNAKWTGFGIHYQYIYKAFVVKPGIQFGSGTFTSPQIILELGYINRLFVF
ncbi:MAG: hypothetical protein HUU10_11840 [Bacteroidetes bacterium]|nr:hypothetical protein [Bacteroidota bacterium]